MTINQYIKNNYEEAFVLWKWLCSKDYNFLGQLLFKLHTQYGINPENVETALNKMFDNFKKSTN